MYRHTSANISRFTACSSDTWMAIRYVYRRAMYRATSPRRYIVTSLVFMFTDTVVLHWHVFVLTDTMVLHWHVFMLTDVRGATLAFVFVDILWCQIGMCLC